MKIETRDFGILEIEERNIITFKQPIFGFEEYTQFVLVNDSNMRDVPQFYSKPEKPYHH